MDEPRKILIIQLKRAGDALLATPIARILKSRWPQAQIDFLIDPAFAPLLAENSSINRVQLYEKKNLWNTFRRIRSQRYDYIFDFQCSPRSAMICLLSGAKMTAGYNVPFWGLVYRQTIRRPGRDLSVVQGKVALVESILGATGAVPHPELFLTNAEQTWAREIIASGTGRGVIGLIPTHRRDSRRWHAESFIELAQKILADGFAVWIFWGPGEKSYVDHLILELPQARLIPATSFREMAALLARCDLVVSNDNGPMHTAAAVGVPTVTIYGPTDPFAWNPGGPRHSVVQCVGLSCLKCDLNQCPFAHECMTGVTPERVWKLSLELLAKTKKAVSA